LLIKTSSALKGAQYNGLSADRRPPRRQLAGCPGQRCARWAGLPAAPGWCNACSCRESVAPK